MLISRERLGLLKEESLRTEVLMPLLRAMGFQDVVHHHGGTTEQGKDIVMWKPGELGERVNYAVVVKAGDINGRAQGAGSAAEVTFQVQQCFGQPFRDSLSAEDRLVDQCWVIASGAIPPAALQSLRSALQARDLIRATRFLDGNKVWELLGKHLPEKTAWEQISQAHKVLQGIVPGFQLSVATDGQTTQIGLSAKKDARGAEPLAAEFRLEFPPTEQGQAAREEYERFVRTGSAFTLPPAVVSEAVLPEPLRRLLGVGDATKLGLSFTPVAPDLPRSSIRFERVCTDGTRAVLEHLDLALVQAGTEEFTLSNRQQGLPWVVTLQVGHRTGALKFSCEVDLKGVNCNQALEWLRFAHALSKSGATKIYSHLTGLQTESRQTDLPPVLRAEEAPSAEFVELVEKLVAIQRRTKLVFWLPEQVSYADKREIEIVYSAITTGKVVLPPDSVLFTGSIEKGILRKDWQRFVEPGTLRIQSLTEQTRSIFGVEIPMGPVTTYCEKAVLVELDLRAMFGRKETKNRRADRRKVKTAFRAMQPDARLWMEYPKWAEQGSSS